MVLFVRPLHRNGSNQTDMFWRVYRVHVNITFGCVQFVSCTSRLFTCINIMAGLGIYVFKIAELTLQGKQLHL